MKRLRKIRIRRDPSKSPLNRFRKKTEFSTLYPDWREIISEPAEEPEEPEETNGLFKDETFLTKAEREDEKLYQILKMMHSEDVDAEHVENNLNITRMELESFVENLVELGFLRFMSDDELEITEEGIDYLKWREALFKDEIEIETF